MEQSASTPNLSPLPYLVSGRPPPPATAHGAARGVSIAAQIMNSSLPRRPSTSDPAPSLRPTVYIPDPAGDTVPRPMTVPAEVGTSWDLDQSHGHGHGHGMDGWRLPPAARRRSGSPLLPLFRALGDAGVPDVSHVLSDNRCSGATQPLVTYTCPADSMCVLFYALIQIVQMGLFCKLVSPSLKSRLARYTYRLNLAQIL